MPLPQCTVKNQWKVSIITWLLGIKVVQSHLWILPTNPRICHNNLWTGNILNFHLKHVPTHTLHYVVQITKSGLFSAKLGRWYRRLLESYVDWIWPEHRNKRNWFWDSLPLWHQQWLWVPRGPCEDPDITWPGRWTKIFPLPGLFTPS